MKSRLAILFSTLALCMISMSVVAQGVGIGTVTPSAAAILDIESTTQGVLVPRLTTTQMEAIGLPAEGLLIYNLDTGNFHFYKNGIWVEIGGSGDGHWTLENGNVYRLSGNVGIGETVPTGKLHVSEPGEWLGVMFTGSGLNDLTADVSNYTGQGSTHFAVRIQNAGPDPNHIEISDDGGTTWSAPLPISNPVDMGQGVNASFGSTGGHTFGNRWDWTANEAFAHTIVAHHGQVGIGTDTVLAKLHIKNGNLLVDRGRIEFANTGGSVFVGAGAGANNDGLFRYNTAIGDSSLYSNTTGSGNTALGKSNLFSNTIGSNNTAVGFGSLHENTTGSYNTATGLVALLSNTTGNFNTCSGAHSLASNINGSFNTASGYAALFYNRANSRSTAIGYEAMFYADDRTNGRETFNTALGYLALRGSVTASNNTGQYNTAVGDQTIFSNTSGSGNTATGVNALYANTTGSYNTASGVSALTSNTSGSFNTASGLNSLYHNRANSRSTAIGYEAMFYADDRSNGRQTFNTAIGNRALRGSTTAGNNTGQYNTAVGDEALFSNTTGEDNTAMGHLTLYSNTTGSINTAAGRGALYFNTTGSNNTATGRAALHANTIGSFRTALGYLANSTGDIYQNNTGLGYNANCSASNQVRIGNSAVTSIGGHAAWTNLSDGRFKTDVIENVVGIDFIRLLRPVTYRRDMQAIDDWWHDNYGTRDTANIETDAGTIRWTGFIAQEVEQAAMSLGYTFSGVDAPKNDQDFYGLRYAEFVVPLVKAVQEQQVILDTLMARLEHLESLMTASSEKPD